MLSDKCLIYRSEKKISSNEPLHSYVFKIVKVVVFVLFAVKTHCKDDRFQTTARLLLDHCTHSFSSRFLLTHTIPICNMNIITCRTIGLELKIILKGNKVSVKRKPVAYWTVVDSVYGSLLTAYKNNRKTTEKNEKKLTKCNKKRYMYILRYSRYALSTLKFKTIFYKLLERDWWSCNGQRIRKKHLRRNGAFDMFCSNGRHGTMKPHIIPWERHKPIMLYWCVALHYGSPITP